VFQQEQRQRIQKLFAPDHDSYNKTRSLLRIEISRRRSKIKAISKENIDCSDEQFSQEESGEIHPIIYALPKMRTCISLFTIL
jgi:Spy/CpxP family protein refolding chaperone